MKESSQKADMRAALRGDLERARERRGATLLDREPGVEPVIDEPELDPLAAEEQEPVAVADVTAEAPEPEPEPEAPEPEPEPEAPEPEPEPEPKRRFLWFLGR